jgi:branched-chain amino acid transport system ATP-binding protein
MTEATLQIERVRARYGSVEVLHGVDLAVPERSVLAVLGPNGAGKSTLLKVVAGLHTAASGEVRVGGRLVTGWAPDRLARRGVCLIPEGRGVFPRLTVRENLWMMTHLGPGRDEVEATVFGRFPRLAERRDQEAGTMSGGEQQMLALARALVAKPSVLLIDELSMGLAPQVVESLYVAVREIAASGTAVVVVEQFAKAALEMADLAAILVSGRITHRGRPDEVEEQLSTAYLGG